MAIKIRPLVYLEEREDPTPVLPPYTLRLKYKDGVTPSFSKGTGVQVSSSPNIWDLTYENSGWSNLLSGHSDLLEVLGVNISNLTGAYSMFNGCTSLTSVPLFDTSNVKYMYDMFNNCTSLTTVPLFDTSNAINMNRMFYNCSNVESGALALYQQASSQTNPPTNHWAAFRNCGSNTTTGSAELAQIPSDWK